jgi:hypothetical protein
MSEEKEQCAGIRPKASVTFTLHVHLDDGTTKDIECVGTVVPEQPPQTDLAGLNKE